jgi:hypothetical protein
MEVIEGSVEAANERGVRIRGDWYNVSKFRRVEMPRAGDHVRLSIDTKGFIMELERMDDDKAVEIVLPDPTATRLAVLQAAAAFLGQLGQTRPDIKAEHVLVLADKWLEWLER